MTMVTGVLFAAVAYASGPAVGPEGGESAATGAAPKENIAEYIFHHVSDDPAEYHLEVPLSEHHAHIHLPQLMFVVREGGSCAPVVDPAHPGETHRAGLGQGCLDLSISKHTVMLFFSALLLITLFLVFGHRNRQQLVPRGTMPNILEMLVLFIRDEIAVKNIGKEWGPKYTGYLLTIFFFILTMNLVGLVPWMATATGNLAVTLALALCTFFITQFASIRAAGLKTYLSHLTGGVPVWLWPIMVPVEILGLFTKPFALTVRLFANMLAGHIVIYFLLALIFIFKTPAMAIVSVPMAMGIYLLELFVAFVQAYVFTMLSSLFIGMGVAIAHHAHDDHGHHDDGHAHAEGGPAGVGVITHKAH